jgi:hypothetical protein
MASTAPGMSAVNPGKFARIPTETRGPIVPRPDLAVRISRPNLDRKMSAYGSIFLLTSTKMFAYRSILRERPRPAAVRESRAAEGLE